MHILFLLIPYIHVGVTKGSALPKPHDLKSSHQVYYQCSHDCVPGHVTKDAQCSYIRECCSDTLGDMLVNYLTFQYCNFHASPALGTCVLCIMLFYGFWMISSLADDYFAPTMEEMARVLGISDELAGVTIVAFGNGAPDISTSVNAILEGGDTTKLGLGALLGAALFGPIVISGIIAIVVPNAAVSAVPLCRDCLFLFIATGCILIITSDEKVTIHEAIGMMVVYMCYVASVVARDVYDRWKRLRNKEGEALIDNNIKMTQSLPYHTDEVMHIPVHNIYNHSSNSSVSSSSRDMIDRSQMNMSDEKESETATSTETTLDIDSESTVDKNRRNHLFEWRKLLWNIFKAPTLIIGIAWKVTIPLANHAWSDEIAIVSCITAPLFIQFTFFRESMTQFIYREIPIVAMVAIGGCIMAAFTFWRIKRKYRESMQNHRNEKSVLIGTASIQMRMRVYDALHNDLRKQAVMKMFFLLLSFLSAVAWFQVISNELVNMLSTLGIVSNIDLTLLGLTISAWGISLTDVSADLSVARRGYARMGIAAAIGGATFNLLIGVGLSTAIKTVSAPNGEDFIPNTIPIFVSCIAVMVAIASYALWVGMNNWILTKPFGYFCFSYYAAFVVIIVALCSYL